MRGSVSKDDIAVLEAARDRCWRDGRAYLAEAAEDVARANEKAADGQRLIAEAEAVDRFLAAACGEPWPRLGPDERRVLDAMLGGASEGRLFRRPLRTLRATTRLSQARLAASLAALKRRGAISEERAASAGRPTVWRIEAEG